MKKNLDEIADIGGLGVFGAHTHAPIVTEDRIRAVLDGVADRDIEVMTLGEACRRFGAD